MKKNKSLLKSAFRDITSSMSRFVSIFGIVAIGVSFFTGLRATAPDMRRSADVYFDNSRLSDFRLVSTVGFDENDVESLSALEGVTVYPAYFADMIMEADGNDSVARVMSLPKGGLPLNILDLDEGRLPEKENECLINSAHFGDTVALGHEIRLIPASGDSLLNNDAYIVTGTYKSPLYIDKSSRGSTSVGNGKIDSVVYIAESCFDSEYYTEVYLSFDELFPIDCYGDEYRDRLAVLESEIETLGDSRRKIRFSEIKEEAGEKIAEGEQELAEKRTKALDELGEAKKKLDDAAVELEDAKKEIDSGKTELEKAEAEILKSEAELKEAEEEYLKGRAEFDKKMAEAETALIENEKKLKDAEAEYLSGLARFLDGEKQLQTAFEDYEKGLSEYKKADKELTQKENEFLQGKSGLDLAYEQYEAGLAQLKEAETKLAETEKTLISLKESYGEDSEEYKRLRAIYDSASAEYAVSKKAADENGNILETEKAKLEEGGRLLEAGRLELDAVKKELDGGKAALDGNKTALEETRIQLEQAEAEIKNGRELFEQGLNEYEKGRAEGEGELKNAQNKILDGYSKIEEGKAEIKEQWNTWNDGFAKYEEGMAEYLSGFAEYSDAEKEAYEKLDEAQAELDDAKRKIEELKNPDWYVFNRDDNPGYTEYAENSDRIRGISEVFPVFFILVAALVCFTTMQRMVEENRLQIGTLKALGYGNGSIIFKYMLYALAPTFLGACFGVLFGMKLFPYVVMTAYGILYKIPVMEMPYDLPIAVLAVSVMVVSITLTVFSACYGELKERPSQLMRPKAPKNGKRVFLERIPFIWKRLGFSQKVSLRNIFRYKRRMFMTVIGISGCTALLLTGFALFDCIGDVVKKQFGEIMTYTGFAAVTSDMTESEEADLYKTLEENKSGYIKLHQKQYDVKNGGKTLSVYICVPEKGGTLALNDIIRLRNRVSGEEYSIENGAVITEKATVLLDLKSGGDELVTVLFSDTKAKPVRINAVTENYAYHYIYMTAEEYAAVFGEKPEYNLVYFKNELSEAENDVLSEKLLDNKAVLTVSLTGGIENSFSSMMEALNMVIYVIIAAAGLLAFIVLYNLTNINITERIREIATLKVLGFYDSEVDSYIFRENLILAAIGSGAGLVLGLFLAQFIVQTAEINMAMFGREIHPQSFILSVLITLAFAAVVTLPMHFKLIGVDMAQSLKSVE